MHIPIAAAAEYRPQRTTQKREATDTCNFAFHGIVLFFVICSFGGGVRKKRQHHTSYIIMYTSLSIIEIYTQRFSLPLYYPLILLVLHTIQYVAFERCLVRGAFELEPLLALLAAPSPPENSRYDLVLVLVKYSQIEGAKPPQPRVSGE